ncbi:S-adenosyl-L-methionine-dependent methyltransferase [Fusarium acuminatum]|uniref:S-adenosyl-L-methionine-dependent methyltransferase n=1 Tax=Fusarium acuminatum TaxID=5515 RepID=A0ABZ2WRK4_9HYPO
MRVRRQEIRNDNWKRSERVTAMGAHESGSKRTSQRSSPQIHDGTSPLTKPKGPETNPPNLDLDQTHGLLHGNATIEAGGSDEDGEFSASDFDLDENSSLASTSRRSSSTSINSSILQHTYENGRRYHRYRHGRYPLPNDEAEQNREDMLHAMMLEATDGRYFYAPVGDNPQRIADLGTGTGIWAIEVGEKYPSAEVLGLDLSPIQPTWVPPNVKFLIDDIEDEWLNGDDFDFVHLRNMIPILKSPVLLLKQIYANMKPGAWVELQDVDGQVHTDDNSIPEDWPLKRFTEIILQAFALYETNAHAAVFGEQYLAEAGFVNIKHNFIKLPYGTWPKDK